MDCRLSSGDGNGPEGEVVRYTQSVSKGVSSLLIVQLFAQQARLRCGIYVSIGVVLGHLGL